MHEIRFSHDEAKFCGTHIKLIFQTLPKSVNWNRIWLIFSLLQDIMGVIVTARNEDEDDFIKKKKKKKKKKK